MTADPFTLPEPPTPVEDTPPAPADLPSTPPAPDVKPKRPTTRAGRRAASATSKAKRPSTKDKKPTGTTPRKAALETRLTDNFVALGAVLAATGGMMSPALAADGLLITQHAASVSAALTKVADQQPAVKAALERMLTAGVYSGLVTAVLPLTIGIAGNHGMLPAGLVAALGGGVAPPSDPQTGASPQGYTVG
jgi:hypothetical protein